MPENDNQYPFVSLGAYPWKTLIWNANSCLTDKIYKKLAPRRGFEPPTCRLGGGRSIRLSYRGVN